jgi:fructose-1,6-bisphosphatase
MAKEFVNIAGRNFNSRAILRESIAQETVAMNTSQILHWQNALAPYVERCLSQALMAE